MKKIIGLFIILITSLSLYAQTLEELKDRLSKEADPYRAQLIKSNIPSQWMQHENPVIQELITDMRYFFIKKDYMSVLPVANRIKKLDVAWHTPYFWTSAMLYYMDDFNWMERHNELTKNLDICLKLNPDNFDCLGYKYNFLKLFYVTATSEEKEKVIEDKQKILDHLKIIFPTYIHYGKTLEDLQNDLDILRPKT